MQLNSIQATELIDAIRYCHVSNYPGFASEQSAANRVAKSLMDTTGEDWIDAIWDARYLAAIAFNTQTRRNQT